MSGLERREERFGGKVRGWEGGVVGSWWRREVRRWELWILRGSSWRMSWYLRPDFWRL